MSIIMKYSLDDYFQSRPVGSIERSMVNNLYGINHRLVPAYLPASKDSKGLVFFTRPQLNLQTNNVRNERLFYPLLNNMAASIQRFIRCTLDPRLMIGYNSGADGINAITCPIVDPKQAFIPVMTNNLKTMSGWPDIALSTFDSPEGLYKEVYSQVDGISKNYSAFDIDATFKNVKGDPILFMMYIWAHYEALVFEGKLVPYPDYVIQNSIDYNTRIYRIVLDEGQRYVKRIACSGVSWPLSLPLGQFFDFNNEKPFNEQVNEFTIRFKCLGVRYMDDIIVHDFNETVCIFNPAMRDSLRDMMMVKVPNSILTFFNNRGYARINPDNYEMEWWVDADVYAAKTNQITNADFLDKQLYDTNGV